MNEADLTLESLSPVGRSGRNVVVGRSHWDERVINECGVSKDEERVARARNLSSLEICTPRKIFTLVE